MNPLHIHSSEKASWHALVTEAAFANQVRLPSSLESYLVLTLMRFQQDPKLLKTVIATCALKAFNQSITGNQNQLREIGDKCLLYSGLFPGLAEKRHVRIVYFVSLGQSAYHRLAHQPNNQDAELYFLLSKRFVSLMDILQSMRELDHDCPSLTPLQAHQLWVDTKSQHAKKILQEYTKSPENWYGPEDPNRLH